MTENRKKYQGSSAEAYEHQRSEILILFRAHLNFVPLFLFCLDMLLARGLKTVSITNLKR